MKVMLDMDGVLTDFRRGVCEAFDFPYDNPSKKWHFWDDWPDVTFEMVNEICTVGFWRNLKWTLDGLEIFKIIFKQFTNDIYLLTTPMPNPGSYTGKAKWVNDHIPVFNNRLIITRAPKSLFAGPNTLLIDDKDENVEEFRATGGQAILIPRSWNKNHNYQRPSYCACSGVMGIIYPPLYAYDYVAHKLDEVVI